MLIPTAMALLAAAPLLLHIAAPGPAAVAYAVVLGSAGGSIRTIEATVLPRWFGIDHIGEIRGVVLAVAVAASAVGPLLVASAGEAFDGYTAVLNLFSGLALVVAVLGALGSRPGPAPRDQQRSSETGCWRRSATTTTPSATSLHSH